MFSVRLRKPPCLTICVICTTLHTALHSAVGFVSKSFCKSLSICRFRYEGDDDQQHFFFVARADQGVATYIHTLRLIRLHSTTLYCAPLCFRCFRLLQLVVLTNLGVGLGGREVDMARPGGDRSCQEILCRAWDSNQNSQPAFGQIFQDRVALLRALHQRSDIFVKASRSEQSTTHSQYYAVPDSACQCQFYVFLCDGCTGMEQACPCMEYGVRNCKVAHRYKGRE